MFSSRRSLALLCLAVVLFTALTPATGVFCLLLVPVFLFFVALVAVPLRPDAEICTVRPFPCLSLFTSRAPPVA